MKILITGGEGFIGAKLKAYCESIGIEAHAMNRSWRLGEKLPEGVQNFSHVIHLAHSSKNQNANALNTQMACREFRDRGVKFQCYVSSFSAGEHAHSVYGQSKFQTEKRIQADDVAIVRPGLVIGDGGIWKRLSGFVKVFRVAVIPGNKSKPVAAVKVEELCKDLVAVILTEKSGLFYSYSNPQKNFKKLIKSELIEMRFICISIPVSVLRKMLDLLDFLKIHTPISRDNLEGFLGNQRLEPKLMRKLGETLWQEELETS